MVNKDYQSPKVSNLVCTFCKFVICTSSSYDSDNGTENFLREDIEEI